MVSIKDVAALANVSTATVSRALSQPDKVSEDTRERVMQAVKQSGYRLNTAARQFRKGRTETVLALVPDIGNPFFTNIIQGIESAALEHGYRVVLGETRPELSEPGSYAGYMQQRHADGAILLGAEGAREFLKEAGDMPAVMACEQLTDASFPTVRIDNEQAALDATRLLIELGHTQIAYINGPPDNPVSTDRLRGYRRALGAAGIAMNEDWISPGDFSPASGYAAARQLMSGSQPPTAIFAISDPMAIGAMRAINELGLTIPGNVSLVGFDDIRFAEFTTPSLTTVHQPRELIGQTAMHQLAAQLAGDDVGGDTLLEHSLITRESTARCER